MEDQYQRLGQLRRQQRLGELPEVLLHHVGDVVRLLRVVAREVVRALDGGFERVDARLDAALPEQTDLVEGVVPQPAHGLLYTRRQRLAGPLNDHRQGNAKHGFTYRGKQASTLRNDLAIRSLL